MAMAVRSKASVCSRCTPRNAGCKPLRAWAFSVVFDVCVEGSGYCLWVYVACSRVNLI
jgi:hypothetical protein